MHAFWLSRYGLVKYLACIQLLIRSVQLLGHGSVDMPSPLYRGKETKRRASDVRLA